MRPLLNMFHFKVKLCTVTKNLKDQVAVGGQRVACGAFGCHRQQRVLPQLSG